MALVTDIFDQNAWGVVEYNEEIVDRVDHKPELLGALNLFAPIYSRSRTILIAERNRTLALIPTSETGAPPKELELSGANVRPFQTHRLAEGSTIYAHELAGLANQPFEIQTKEVTEEVADRNGQIIDEMELTWEHMRFGAIQGVVYDADGTTVLHNWFDEWGITPPDVVNFALATATTDVRKKCRDVGRAMQRAAKGVWTPRTRIGALVGDNFYDALINHPQIKETKIGTERAPLLENIEGYSAIEIENITFINHRGMDDGSTLTIPTDDARFFPIGARGAFQVGYGPAEFHPYVNRRGQERYGMLLPDPSGRNAWDRVEQYSYPLFICTRPEMLLRGKRTGS